MLLVLIVRRQLTASKKSPGLSPDISATPPGSTSSRYCKAGHLGEGFSCINGEADLAPLKTNPNPRLAR